MANKITKIPVLEKILRKRFHSVGKQKVEIGNFWSILQIYICTQSVGISINTICKVASLLEGRIDSKYKPDYSPINPTLIRRYLSLQSAPSHVSHTVVTKSVSRGATPKLASDIKDILVKNNSYGPELLNEIMSCVDSGSGTLIDRKVNILGSSSFSQVLKLCVAINELHREGLMPDMTKIKNSEHAKTIIECVNNNKKLSITNSDELGAEV